MANSSSATHINNRWKKMQADTKMYPARNKKIIPNREAELAAMEQFIASKGITVCNPESSSPEQARHQEFKLDVTLNWRG